MKECLFQCREPLPQGAAVALAADRLYLALGKSASLSWAAVKELKLSYYIGKTLLFTMYTRYGNLI